MKTLDDWPRVKRVLEEALVRHGADRQAYLAEACGADAALRARVDTLLAAAEHAGTFLESPAARLLEETRLREDLSGRVVSSYRLLSRLGAGGMGEVYLAHDAKLDRPVAIKFLSPELAAHGERLRRFHQEARAASRLNHPHIIVVHDFGELDGRPYMVTEFIEGETLGQRLKQGPLPIRDVVEIGIQMTSALAAAHARGLVHRDIKPDNVMVRPDGYVKVLDFGLAKLAKPSAEEVDSHTQTGMVIGTPRYMSPEQACGLDLDARTDVWSLGVVLYEMATGRLPFAGSSAAPALDASLPSELFRIIRKALETDRDLRYESAAELGTDLKHVKRDTESLRIDEPVSVTPRASIPAECTAGEEALRRGSWTEAQTAFETALRVRETPEALEGLGLAAWWLDLGDVVFECRERAHRAYVARGDHAAAARVAVWIAWDCVAFRGEHAVASGWLQRAHRLLDPLPECSEHAWLALREGVLHLFEEGDPDRAHALATEGIRIARAAGNVNLEMMGIALQGVVLVTSGAIAEGIRRLDEVNAAIVGGELTDPLVAGLASCYMIAACDRVRDYDRAVQWCARLKTFSAEWGFRPLLAVCRTQYASICMWRGIWPEAEQELSAASDEFAASRPAMSGDALVRLAELRRRQGRASEAEALFERAGAHPLGLLGRAELALDQDDARTAADLSARYLRRLAPHNRIERAAGLELLVRARVGVGDFDGAKAMLAELTEIATMVATPSMRASASMAGGVIALGAGDAETAREHFEDAVDQFLQSGAPFELARARIGLAHALQALDRVDAAVEEAQRAVDLLTELKAEFETARARRFVASISQPHTGG